MLIECRDQAAVWQTHINASYPKAWETDPYVLAPTAPSTLRRDTLVEGMHYPRLVHREGLIVENLFGPYDARLMRRSFVTRNQSVALRVGATPSVYTKWLALIAAHPGAWSSLTTCPADVLIRDGKWRYKVVATAGSQAATVTLSGDGDPGEPRIVGPPPTPRPSVARISCRKTPCEPSLHRLPLYICCHGRGRSLPLGLPWQQLSQQRYGRRLLTGSGCQHQYDAREARSHRADARRDHGRCSAHRRGGSGSK